MRTISTKSVYSSNIPVSVCLALQDTGAGGIDWGDSEVAPIEIEIVDAGTDCKNFLTNRHYVFS